MANIKDLLNLCKKLRKDLCAGKISIDDLVTYKDTVFKPVYNHLLTQNERAEDYVDFLYLCLDFYTYSDQVLISDYDYDQLMNEYLCCGGKYMSTADVLARDTKWNVVKHDEPGVVGTVSKVYTNEELDAYFHKYRRISEWIIAPKYDGISSAIKVKNGEIVKACTRYDGVNGQDITELVKTAKNADTFMKWFELKNYDGYYKCELAVSAESFEELIQEKPYANKRSATSGIVNSPKNIQYGKYVSIIPLAYYNANDAMRYKPLGYKHISHVGSSDVLMRHCEEMLRTIRSAEFEFRTDGVVMMPYDDTLGINPKDLMADAIAYKVNTKYGLTKLQDVYVSVGRMGKAVPMAKVIPVEVNETIVSDISLGSFDKAIAMNLHKDETVMVYSAGDVIPQMKVLDEKEYPRGAECIDISMRCPFCGKKLDRAGREMFCKNENCSRVIVGKIANFAVSIGMENISDATVEDLVNAKLVSDITDLFKLNADDIMKIPGYAGASAMNIVNEIRKIMNTDISIDTFFGALGIPDVKAKTARKIFSIIDIDDIYKKRAKLYWMLISADGIGKATAESFINYVKDNIDIIDELRRYINITKIKTWKGNVVFTGFRDKELEAQFNSRGYEVSENINYKTEAVISSSGNSSTKCNQAMKRGIDIYQLSDVDVLLKLLKSKK